ncbi:hypothetical protein ACHAWT_002248 [Skeletonema menzelii]
MLHRDQFCTFISITVPLIYLSPSARALRFIKYYIQVSKEGDTFEVPIQIAKLSNLVVTTLGGDDDTHDHDNTDEEPIEIPLPNVRTQVLAKVIEYCTHFSAEPMTPITTPLKSTRIDEIVQEWYADFVDVDQIMLFELVTAANFMDIKALLDLTCLAVSVLIKVSEIDTLSMYYRTSLGGIQRHIICSPCHHLFLPPSLLQTRHLSFEPTTTGQISRRNPQDFQY